MAASTPKKLNISMTDYVSISTPFIDTNFDNINLYARFLSKDKVEVSDFGYTIAKE